MHATLIVIEDDDNGRDIVEALEKTIAWINYRAHKIFVNRFY